MSLLHRYQFGPPYRPGERSWSGWLVSNRNDRRANNRATSPWQNGYGESFNRKFRDECLNMEVFHPLSSGHR
jgi:hypothetical protein